MLIMVAYDGSEVAKEALRLAQSHAKAFQAEIEVVQAVEKATELEYEEIDKREKKLDQEIHTLLQGDNIDYRTTLLAGSGSAGEQIVRRVERKKGDQICMGVKRRSKVGKLLFGSTAQYVVINAPCPVLTIR